MYKDDHALLKDSNAKLNDTVIDSYSSMLAKHFECRHSIKNAKVNCQSVLCSPFKPQEGRYFFQVLHLKPFDHWVMVSNITCKDPDVVNLYDSDIKPIMNRKKLEMIAKSVLELRPSATSLETVEIYKQTDDVSCGVIALYYAWCLCTSTYVKMWIPMPVFVRRQIAQSFITNTIMYLVDQTRQVAVDKNKVPVKIISSVSLAKYKP